ncbi:multiple epidermal growth factor-like domains protein 11 [Ostrea edulis]|uniref:multiple epidermal growth factor-like domains protein 11 n=1 Tax=Ostrea edulis TaxID=37623 RepID=UPI0024AEC5F9|nr:multiple epidermal growth factor-like domains protein 11 [Ostrea edulis]
MELIKLSVMYLMVFSARKTFQNITAGCPDGYYRNETSGTCSVCRPGYIGPNCSVSCGEGFYGTGCQQQCSSSCSICNIIDGSCPKACRPGYIGPNCSVSCGEGLYGKGCQQKCPSSCSICNIIDGSCPKGLLVIHV